jgi:hypothetical protein
LQYSARFSIGSRAEMRGVAQMTAHHVDELRIPLRGPDRSGMADDPDDQAYDYTRPSSVPVTHLQAEMMADFDIGRRMIAQLNGSWFCILRQSPSGRPHRPFRSQSLFSRAPTEKRS